MGIIHPLVKQKVFDEEGKLSLTYTEAVERLLGYRKPSKSVIDVYLEQVVLPCGSTHAHTLKILQEESLKRLGYDGAGKWLEMLRERLTWHDVIVWLLLLELKECGHQPDHRELDLLKNIHVECTKDDKTRFNTLYGLMYIRGGDEKVV